jgi:hypothetical protein
MQIVIHGTNGGYHIFTPEKGKMLDARPDSNKVGSIGQQAYSINYTESSIVFSKYRIIRDVVGDKRTGNVAFSIIIPHSKKLSGIDVLAILDKLSNYFCSKHIVNDNLDNFKEDWGWVSEIKCEFEIKLKNNDDLIAVGSADSAFLYYNSSELLQKYFDLPYQEEYSAYKQIFFVDKTFEGKPENPLNALRHDSSANLTSEIDIENPKYKLIYNQHAGGGVKIEVKVNGSLRYSKSKINRKEDLQIIWSKQFCETKVKSGKWYEIGSEYLNINDVEKTITVKEIDIDPTTYTLSIHTKDRFSNPITDAAITLKIGNYSPGRNAINNTIQITEEELQNKCYIFAQKDNLISPQREIKREDTKGSISLILSEHKKVSFIVQDENGSVKNYKIQISNKEVQPKDGDVVFIGEEIEKTWQISVSHRDYETKRFDYCPAENDKLEYVTLEKKTFGGKRKSPPGKMYHIIIDETKGKRRCNGKRINEYENEPPTNKKCDAKYGYKFIEWKKENSQSLDGGVTFEAIFKELWYRRVPKLAWIFGVFAIVASTVFLLINSDGSENDTSIVNAEINNKVNSYIDGIELNLDTLKEYQRKYCDSTSFIQSNVKEKSWWQKISIFGSDDNNNSANELLSIPVFCSKIDNARAIRNAINLGKIEELKGQVFSESQQNFKKSIDSIEDRFIKKIGNKLNASKVRGMNLNEVADLILKTQSDLIEKETVIQKEIEPKKIIKKDNNEKTVIKVKQKIYLPKQKLNSNSLKDEFWNLVRSGNTQKEKYDNLLKKHQSKAGDDIIAYLNKICKNSDSFRKFKSIEEMDRKSANTLTDIDIN